MFGSVMTHLGQQNIRWLWYGVKGEILGRDTHSNSFKGKKKKGEEEQEEKEQWEKEGVEE